MKASAFVSLKLSDIEETGDKLGVHRVTDDKLAIILGGHSLHLSRSTLGWFTGQLNAHCERLGIEVPRVTLSR